MPQKKNQEESNLSAGRAEGRLFYGWVVAIAGAVVIFMAANYQYSFGVFVKPLAGNFGWSRAAISGCVSIRSIVSGVSSPLIGALSDRYEPRKFILLGVLLVGLCYAFASRITSLWHLYLLLGVLTGIGFSAAFIPTLATVNRWFGGKSALANGIVYSGFSLSQLVIPPAAMYIIVRYGWETCFVVLGVVVLVLGFLAWCFIRTKPSSVNIAPEVGNAGKLNEVASEPENHYTLSEALRTNTLWIILLVYVAIAIYYQMISIHVIAAAIDTGISPEAAAIILTLGGAANIVGRLGLSVVAGKLGNRLVITFSLAIQILALFILAQASDLSGFYISVAIAGLGYGVVGPLIVTLAGSYFGTKFIAPIYGMLIFSYTLGIAIGPLLAGYIFDATGSYFTAFFSAAIVMSVAFVLWLLIKPPKKKIVIT